MKKLALGLLAFLLVCYSSIYAEEFGNVKVQGTVTLPQLKNKTTLGTDANGNIIEGSGTVSGGVTADSPTFTGSVTMPGTGKWNSVGKVGIGTDTPQTYLDIDSANTSTLKVGKLLPLYLISNHPIIGFNSYWDGANYNYGKGSTTEYAGALQYYAPDGTWYFKGTAIGGIGGVTATMSNLMTLSSAGVLTIGTAVIGGRTYDSTNYPLTNSAIDTSAELRAILGDEAGTGSAVFSVSPSFTGTATFESASFSGTISGTSSNTGHITFANTNGYSVTIQPSELATANTTYKLPTADGSANQVLKTNGSGVLSWTANGTATPSGTTGDVQFNSSGSLDGTTKLSFNKTIGKLTVGDTSAVGKISIHTTGGKYISFKGGVAPTGTDDKIYTLPQNDGSAGQVLSTDGSANLSWTSAGTATAAGTNYSVQYKNAGATTLGGTDTFTFSNGKLAISGATNLSATNVNVGLGNTQTGLYNNATNNFQIVANGKVLLQYSDNGTIKIMGTVPDGRVLCAGTGSFLAYADGSIASSGTCTKTVTITVP